MNLQTSLNVFKIFQIYRKNDKYANAEIFHVLALPRLVRARACPSNMVKRVIFDAKCKSMHSQDIACVSWLYESFPKLSLYFVALRRVACRKKHTHDV